MPSESDDEQIAEVAEEALEEYLVWKMAEAEMGEDSELPDSL